MKKIIPAERTDAMKYAIRDVVVEANRLAKQGKKILYLNIGDPMKYDYETPRHLIDAVEKNWSRSSSYADSSGIEDARMAIAKEAVGKGMAGTTPEDILVTTGGSEAITIALGALINKGDNFLSPSPGYPLYTTLTSYFSAEFNEYNLDEEDSWKPDLDDMRKKINDKTKAILIINPNNPTGSLYDKNTIKKIIDIAGESNLPILADETYDKLIFDGEKHFPVASMSRDVPVISFNTLSKNYLCPGWRIGWSIMHDPADYMSEVREAMNKLARARLSSPHPMQYAVKAAIEGDHSHIKNLVEKKLKERRDLTFKRLNEIRGMSLVKPKGAFYAFPRINLDVGSDEKFCMDLLRETGVLTVFGSGFGEKKGTHHFRMVFLPKPEILNEAFDNLEGFIEKHY
jgi:alanine-synthesizing transaminase